MTQDNMTRVATVLLAGSMLMLRVDAAHAVCDTPGSGGNWPVFQHDVTATGSQPDETTIAPGNVAKLEKKWGAALSGRVESEPLSDGGCVFIGTQSGWVYAFDVETGDKVWETKLSSETNTLSIADGRVFVQTGSRITALAESDGKQLWQREFSSYGSSSSPLAAGGYVFFAMGQCGQFGSRPKPCKSYYALLNPMDGAVVVDGHVVSEEDAAQGMEAPSFWGRPSYDPEDKNFYMGTSNYRSILPENPLGAALLKIDADPKRPSFGKIVGYFRPTPLNPGANLPEYQWCAAKNTPVNLPPSSPGPLVFSMCQSDDDLTSTAIPYRDSSGRKLLGITAPTGGKGVMRHFTFGYNNPKGEYSAVDPTTTPNDAFGGTRLEAVWATATTGTRAAAAAYDGSKFYFQSGHSGELIAANKDTGSVAWKVGPPTMNPGTGIFQQVTHANGVVYTLSSGVNTQPPSGNGLALLLAHDAESGAELLQRPIQPDVGAPTHATVAGGVTIARNTIFVPVNAEPRSTGYLVAYRLP